MKIACLFFYALFVVNVFLFSLLRIEDFRVLFWGRGVSYFEGLTLPLMYVCFLLGSGILLKRCQNNNGFFDP